MSQPRPSFALTAACFVLGAVLFLGACADSPTALGDAPSVAFEEVEGPTCSAGLWKNDLTLWDATPYDPGQTIGGVFASAGDYSDDTLLAALEYGGGPGMDGATRLLLRAGVAALLNASYPGNDIALDEEAVKSAVDEALTDGSRKDRLRLAGDLEAASDVACVIVSGGGLPDLVVSSIELIGESDWRATVTNVGAGTADLTLGTFGVLVQAFASADSQLDIPGDQGACGISLTQTGTTSLAPGESTTAQPGCTASWRDGAIVLFVIADYGEVLGESDETNNVLSVSLQP